MVRAVVLVVTVSLTLVLLPIAINVGTGGTAPRFLAPYAGWTWPLIGLLWPDPGCQGRPPHRRTRRPPLGRVRLGEGVTDQTAGEGQGDQRAEGEA